MLKMPEDTEDPSSRSPEQQEQAPDLKQNQSPPQDNVNGHEPRGFAGWLKNLFKPKPDTSLREAIEEYIEEPESFEDVPTISAQERAILSNILDLRDIKVIDVMVPRADIIAIDVNTTKEELFTLLAEKQFSRIPVYRETLDEVVGTVHIKDIMAAQAQGEKIHIQNLVTGIPIVSPSMNILDLVLKMRQSRRHMVMVVDEYGGIDGLVTIGDVIESIIGEVDDEHDIEDAEIVEKEDGSYLVDGRVDLEEFEERFGDIFSDEEREEIDTMGGLVSAMAGHVPARGEILTHGTGMLFEVLDADPRRINRLRISKIPASREE